uniref:Alpha-N-acetylneuraminide alpha-2,8-sialyltransferase isoform X2 n=1 Tax=Phascolarctos cinereus TaxID=38626 RepID=A0A6P5KVV4_PHACI|nr:alpha-N-acetylneuraminide alpha-2,8-sialyltransferase isoform X2 [Phascolarctos cinereus]
MMENYCTLSPLTIQLTPFSPRGIVPGSYLSGAECGYSRGEEGNRADGKVPEEDPGFFISFQATPFQLPLKKCSVVGNGGILKKSVCGRQIDEANFVMRCNLPPLSSEYNKDVGFKTHLVTANPSIIRKRFQNLLWSRKTFVDDMKVYNHSYIYMPAFSMKTGTEPSLRVYYTLADVGANQTVLFANPNFLRSIGKFWKSRGIHAKRLSTGLFLVSAALGLCDKVTIYGFWPFSMDLREHSISHHYYDNELPYSGFHAMPEEFLQLWYLHKIGVLKMQLEPCEDLSFQPTS